MSPSEGTNAAKRIGTLGTMAEAEGNDGARFYERHPPRDLTEDVVGGPALRIGHGYDLHRLEPRRPLGRGRQLILGGVRLNHPRGPVARSDGDALFHAVTDALLGAVCEPDIGQLFPDSDPQHEAADSRVFLVEADRRVHAAGWFIANVDATVVLEWPKLSPHKIEMCANLADALRLPTGRVNIKGKTHERVDAVGQGRAVEAHAVVLLTRQP